MNSAARNLRFDDTNPDKEEQEYVDSIIEDVRWLGFEWDGSPLLRLRLLRSALRVGRAAHQDGQGLRLRSDAPIRSARSAAPSTEPGNDSPIAIAASRKISISSTA